MNNRNNINSTLGSRLKSLRMQNKLTQEDLSKMLFLSKVQISKYENGKVKIPRSQAERLAEIFGVDVEYLLDENCLYPSESVKFASVIEETQIEGLYIKQALEALLRLNGYEPTFATFEGHMSIEECFSKIKNNLSVTKDGKKITLTVDQVNTLGNIVNDCFIAVFERTYGSDFKKR